MTRWRVNVVIVVVVIVVIVVVIIIISITIVASGAAKISCSLIIVYLNSTRLPGKLTRTVKLMVWMTWTFEVTSTSVFPIIVSVSPRLLIHVRIFKGWISSHPSRGSAWS